MSLLNYYYSTDDKYYMYHNGYNCKLIDTDTMEVIEEITDTKDYAIYYFNNKYGICLLPAKRG